VSEDIRSPEDGWQDSAADVPAPVCPACHHHDHDPGSCEWCASGWCELHYDEVIEWLRRNKALPNDDAVWAFIRKVADMPEDATIGTAPRRVLELIQAKAIHLLEDRP